MAEKLVSVNRKQVGQDGTAATPDTERGGAGHPTRRNLSTVTYCNRPLVSSVHAAIIVPTCNRHGVHSSTKPYSLEFY